MKGKVIVKEKARQTIFVMVERTFEGAPKAEALMARTRNPAPVLAALGIQLKALGFTGPDLEVIVKFCDPKSKGCLPPK